MNNLQNKDNLTILAIESSCDETACAILRDGKILGECISTQIEIHRLYGGVVPEIASRNHVLSIDAVVKDALSKAGLTLSDIDCIAVTKGAGLLGSLLVGVSYAKGLAFALNKPLIGINHIRGHIAANYLEHPELTPPYVGLIVSGGHSAVALVKSKTYLEIKGTTADDAAGEAFDKVARVLGLPYPGGPEIERLAKQGEPTVTMPHVKMKNPLDFSYSGLKTAVINYVHNAEQKGVEINKADVACSFQKSAVDMLSSHAIELALSEHIDTIAVAGGVAANGALRETLTREAGKHHLKVYFPSKKLCTDNASMIASEAYVQIRNGADFDELSLDATATLPLK